MTGRNVKAQNKQTNKTVQQHQHRTLHPKKSIFFFSRLRLIEPSPVQNRKNSLHKTKRTQHQTQLNSPRNNSHLPPQRKPPHRTVQPRNGTGIKSSRRHSPPVPISGSSSSSRRGRPLPGGGGLLGTIIRGLGCRKLKLGLCLVGRVIVFVIVIGRGGVQGEERGG